MVQSNLIMLPYIYSIVGGNANSQTQLANSMNEMVFYQYP